jgi:RecJ-like exonuclease
MRNKKGFLEHVMSAVEFFRGFDSKTVRVISHLDSDGICACSILSFAFNNMNRNFSITIVPQLEEKVVKELNNEEDECFVFADLGSGQLDSISKIMKDKKILVLDHHEIQGNAGSNIFHLNTHDFGLDDNELSGAGVAFFFGTALDKRNEAVAHIAVIGAIGDVQEDNGFKGLNQEILDIAVKSGKIKVNKGLRLFGLQSRPVHKLLEYSNDIGIPGVTGSESGAIQFLNSLRIDPKIGNRWKIFYDLSDDEQKRLIAGIIMKHGDDDVFANVYQLPEEQGPFRDAREFSTLLNACGRLDRASFGIGALLGDDRMRQKVLQTHQDYKKEIVNGLNWYEKNKGSDRVVDKDGVVILNTGRDVMPTVIGTIASIIAKSNNFDKKHFIMSLARNDHGKTKISLRVTHQSSDDLRSLINEIVDVVGGEAGGHQYAAGAIINTENEDDFLRVAERVLKRNTTFP